MVEALITFLIICVVGSYLAWREDHPPKKTR